MNPNKFILAAAVLFSAISQADEKTKEVSIDAIEVEHFIINWSPNSKNLGRALIYSCDGCAPVTMTFNKDTALVMNGKNQPIEAIKSKVDWSGLITVTNDAPTEIIEIRIY